MTKIDNKFTNTCLVCKSRHLYYSFSLFQHRIVQCNDCGLMLLNPQPSDEVLGKIYSDNYFVLSDQNQGISHVETLKKSTAARYLDQLIPNGIQAGASLLEIGCGSGDFLKVAAMRGLKVTGVEYSPYACDVARAKLKGFNLKIYQGEINVLAGSKECFDYIVFCDVLEHVRDPRMFLKQVFELLKPNGEILCVVPSLDSWSARLLKTKWMEFKLEHLTYFDTKNLRSLLFQEKFSQIKHFSAKKTLSVHYIAGHFVKHPVPGWSQLVRFGAALLPKSITRFPFPIIASGIGMIAKKQDRTGNLLLSIIMPALNEVSTIKDGIDNVLKKTIDGIDIELILVESNSSDGTRQIVQQYSDHPRVKVILEEHAKGKGYAVRTGLKSAKGDFILIQDADNEYDIDDYDALLEPLRDGREAFILGARHGGGAWKMRTFSDQPFRAFILNFGHWAFVALINIFYGVWLRDPFTMYKVFRRDCIEGVTFECDRFDFDCELLIKLVKKGFRPLEIPVNYRSRSFLEGKKVRLFSDPITWLKAIIKYRFTNV
jgi:2-polyprenyl-3-methyl-5-hydroxy-6-metoxy-1,4-benzoquinol methylase